MAHPFRAITRLLSRWSRQQETALFQMGKGKTVDQRIGGYSKSEDVNAKFLLLASAPTVATLLARELGWSPQGFFAHATVWLCLGWGAIVGGFALVGYFRAIRRATHGKK